MQIAYRTIPLTHSQMIVAVVAEVSVLYIQLIMTSNYFIFHLTDVTRVSHNFER